MGHRTLYDGIPAILKDLDIDLIRYSTERPHQGHGTKGPTTADVLTQRLPKPRATRAKQMKQTA